MTPHRSSAGVFLARTYRRTVLAIAVVLAAPHLHAQAAGSSGDAPIPPGYGRTEVMIPMRDGVKLDAHVLAPTDTGQRYPVLLVRTPYDPLAPWMLPEAQFLRARYIFVIESVRGRYGSEGEFIHMTPQLQSHARVTDVDASTDTYDTVEWLVKNLPNNNGRVGLRGISYNGFYAAAGMIGAHPALKAVSPQAPQADWFAGDDVHHNGAFLLASAFSFMTACDRSSDRSRTCADVPAPATDGYAWFLSHGPLAALTKTHFDGTSHEWTVLMTHGTYDELWQRRNLLPHLVDIRPAVLVVSGWYDANNLYGALHVFDAVHRQSAATTLSLVLGPWTHGEWRSACSPKLGPLDFGADTCSQFIDEVELPFFESHLKDGPKAPLPVARVFDTGAKAWGSFDAWPPREAEAASLYLGANHGLGFAPPPPLPGANSTAGGVRRAATPSSGSSASEARAAFDEYVSDPARPVPFVPSNGFDMDADYMTRDQSFTDGRADVLTYETPVLTQAITVAGPIRPRLVVSSSGTDSDWVVRVIDVHPGASKARPGIAELVRGDVMRAKFRTGLGSPSALVPDQPTPIEFTLLDVYHTFEPGHRIRVEIQSSWFPLVDLNPQRFEDIYTAKAADFQKATQRVYHTPDRPSRIELELLPRR